MLAINEEIITNRRSKGERTKHRILESAIAILAIQGIKGTTHRAIASHADIQLSLTTYYFKDIQELVLQAFELNSFNVISQINTAWQPAIDVVDKHSKAELRSVSVRVELRAKLTDILVQLITHNTTNNRQQLIVEQQLFSEIQVTSALRTIAKNHHFAQLQPCLLLCQYFAKEGIEINAELLLSQIQQIQYRQLLLTDPTSGTDDIRTKVEQILALVLRVRP
jgi:DNA-binding transcriptional regulator YbjK